MDFLAGPIRRRILFGSLYLSEGAPIGFIWLTIPTRLRDAGVSVGDISTLTALAVVPWTFKFLWAPLVDALQSDRWTRKHWVISAQFSMGLMLLPLIWLDWVAQLHWLIGFVLLHAFSAATQDVAIDALCIATTEPVERGRLNGWMQAGMLIGRALMGGGALVLARQIGFAMVVVVLIAMTMFSSALLLMSRIPAESRTTRHPRPMSGGRRGRRLAGLVKDAIQTVLRPDTWLAFVFALLAPAAFKAFDANIGTFLIDHRYTPHEVGRFTATIVIGATVIGSLAGGFASDRLGHRHVVGYSLLMVVVCIGTLAGLDWLWEGEPGAHLQWMITFIAFWIGSFTVSAYAMFMDLTTPSIAATQFTAFMSATNACESWSTFTMGQIVDRHGYPAGMLTLCGVSFLTLGLLFLIRKPDPTIESHADSLDASENSRTG